MNDSQIDRSELYKKLKSKSTFLLLVLGIVTYGVYFSYYFKKISKVLNEYLDTPQKIPMWMIKTFIGISYIDVVLFLPNLFFSDNFVIDLLTSLSCSIFFALMTIITLLIMIRMNSICMYQKDSSNRIRILPALLFECLYINYKVNSFDSSNLTKKVVHPLYYLLLTIEIFITSTTLAFIVPQVAVRMEDFEKELSTLVLFVMSSANFLQKYLLILLAIIILFKFIFSKKFDLLYAPIIKSLAILGIGILIWLHLDLLWLSFLSRGFFESLWVLINVH